MGSIPVGDQSFLYLTLLTKDEEDQRRPPERKQTMGVVLRTRIGSSLNVRRVAPIVKSLYFQAVIGVCLFPFLGVLKVIALTAVSWVLLTGLVQFVLSTDAGKIFGITLMIIFIAVPTVNHVRMFFAIRRHKTFAAGASVPSHLTVVLRREKKVALDMAVISLVLLLSLLPQLINKIIEAKWPKLYIFFQPWTLTMVFLISSLNPIIYMLRNKALRTGMKSVLFG